MFRVLADNVDAAVAADDLAILADWLGAGSHFHNRMVI